MTTISPCASVGDQTPFHPEPEDDAVHRTINDERCGDAIVTQPGDEGHRLPVAMGYGGDQTLAAPEPAAKPRHLGVGAGLVDEDQSGRVERRLSRAPYAPLLGHVRTVLLGRVRGFF